MINFGNQFKLIANMKVQGNQQTPGQKLQTNLKIFEDRKRNEFGRINVSYRLIRTNANV